MPYIGISELDLKREHQVGRDRGRGGSDGDGVGVEDECDRNILCAWMKFSENY